MEQTKLAAGSFRLSDTRYVFWYAKCTLRKRPLVSEGTAMTYVMTTLSSLHCKQQLTKQKPTDTVRCACGRHVWDPLTSARLGPLTNNGQVPPLTAAAFPRGHVCQVFSNPRMSLQEE